MNDENQQALDILSRNLYTDYILQWNPDTQQPAWTLYRREFLDSSSPVVFTIDGVQSTVELRDQHDSRQACGHTLSDIVEQLRKQGKIVR